MISKHAVRSRTTGPFEHLAGARAATHSWLVRCCYVVTLALLACDGSSWPSSTRSVSEREGSNRKQLIRLFRDALRDYDIEHGTLPYDARGDEYALFNVRNYIHPAEIPEIDGRERPCFDEHKGVLVHNPFEYINAPEATIDTMSPPDTIILAESPNNVATEGRWLCCAHGLLTCEVIKGQVAGRSLASLERPPNSSNR